LGVGTLADDFGSQSRPMTTGVDRVLMAHVKDQQHIEAARRFTGWI